MVKFIKGLFVLMDPFAKYLLVDITQALRMADVKI
jgi:hypothetical protein